MTAHYNLDMIIALGYRVRSRIATRFRQWATERLKEYIIKGFTLDDERLKKLGGGSYWKELLERIRDIRATVVGKIVVGNNFITYICEVNKIKKIKICLQYSFYSVFGSCSIPMTMNLYISM